MVLKTTRYRSFGGGGGAVDCPPTVTWDDTFGIDDFMQIIYGVNFPDTFAVTEDALGISTGLFDSLAFDDSLQAQLANYHADTFAVDDGPLGFVLKLFETLGIDDRLSFVTALITQADTFAMDDQLTLAQVVAIYGETFGIDDALHLDLFSAFQDESVGVTDNLGVKTSLSETLPLWFDYKLSSASPFPEGSHQIAWTDAAPFSILGDIDIAVMLAYTDWSPAGFPTLISKWPNTATQRSWILSFDGSGTGGLLFAWSADGTATVTPVPVSTAPVPATDGSFIAVRVTMDVNDGAGNRVIKFYTKAMTLLEAARGGLLTPLSTWTQLGTTITQAGTTSIFNSTTSIHLGSHAQGANPFAGKFAAAAIRNGIEGTLVLDWRAADAISPFDTVLERANSAPTLLAPGIRDRSRYVPFFNFADTLTPIVKPIIADTVGIDDAFTSAKIANWICGSSASPDTDPCGDSWIDQASGGTNHGVVSPLVVKGKSTLADDERRAVMEFDFTRYSGMSPKTGGTHRVTIRLTNTSGLLGVTLTATLRRVTSRPFTESTVTWNSPGTLGTTIKGIGIQLDPGETRDALLTISDAELTDILADGWLRIDITGPSAGTPITVNVVSREGAAADSPTLDFELQR